ncbi:hypothetical protein BKA62DRAFT_9840 [Auriculariales sp. MPI-PUGE-AT-0066]|nr:hypothetical protein BKA62DRAFT_9840 [Auriculariales sp. MPI-PUGE-AT-0066]
MRLRLVDASSTLGALDSIRNTQDPRAVQTFQDLYLNSNIASLARAVEDDASASPRERIASLGLFVASYTLHSCRATNLASHDEAERVSSAASKLHNDATAASVALANGLGGEQSIATELKKAELNVRAVTNGLQWWHVPLNLDDVSYIVKRAVDSFWGIELEKKLAFFAGRLQSARTTHMEQADGVLNNTPVAFKSALLLNEVEQARSLPSATITPDSLSVPIVKRRELLNAPTTALHRRAQSLVLSTGATSFVAVSMSYAAWASSFLDAGSAVGLAALVSVGTLRWSISRWERAQRRWWEAWDRIVQSLARDIQAELRRTLADGVFLVPNRVADGLLESTNRRLSDLADKNAEETRLSQAVDALVVETRASHQNAMSSAVRMPEVSIAQPKLESIQTMQH